MKNVNIEKNIITRLAACAAYAALLFAFVACEYAEPDDSSQTGDAPAGTETTGVLVISGAGKGETYSAAVYLAPAVPVIRNYDDYTAAVGAARLKARSDTSVQADGAETLEIPLRTPAGNPFTDTARRPGYFVEITVMTDVRRTFYQTDAVFKDGSASLDLLGARVLDTEDIFVRSRWLGQSASEEGSALKAIADRRVCCGQSAFAPLFIALDAGIGDESLPSMASALKAGENAPPFVTIDGGGRTVSLAGTGPLLRIGAGVTLTLRNITLRGVPNNSDALVVADGGALVLGPLSSIADNTNLRADGTGGGVYMAAGTLSIPLNGGDVLRNRAYTGGGVYLTGRAVLDMGGGLVTNNTTVRSYGGGGVYCTKGRAQILGDPVIGVYGSGPGRIIGNTDSEIFEPYPSMSN